MLGRTGFKSLLLAIGVFAISSTSAQAEQAMKVGYIDMQSAINNTADYQRGMKRLRAMQEQKVKELKALGEKINQQEKSLLGQSMAMSPDRLAQKQQELKSMRTELQRKQQDAQQALSAEKNRLDMGIGAKFEKVVGNYGKEKGFDMIMPKPMFLYVNPKYDVTADITKLLDAEK